MTHDENKLPESIVRFYNAVTSINEKHKITQEIMFENSFCKVSVLEIARAFRPGGMLNSGAATVGIYIISERYRESEKLVVPYWITAKLYRGDISPPVIKWFSNRVGNERVDKKKIIVFPMLDPPAPKRHPSEADGVGHWVTISLDLKRRCFQYIDSLYGKDDNDGWAIFLKMVKIVRIFWKTVSSGMGFRLTPDNIDNFETRYMNTTKQNDGCSCGFFMLPTVQSWNGRDLMNFTQNDIANIKKTMLYSWAMSSHFNIDFNMLFGYHPGESMDFSEENFSLFETQVVKPDHEVITISSQEDVEVLKEKPVVQKTPNSKKLPEVDSGDDAFDKIVVGNESTYTDDFVRPIVTTRSGRLAPGMKGIHYAAKKNKKTGIDSVNLLSNKRASKKAKKWSQPVEPLRLVEFTNIENARLLKNFMLSKHATEKYKDIVFARFVHGVDDTGFEIDTTFTGKDFERNFANHGHLKGEMMDFVVSSLNSDPTMSHVFSYGNRVLLSLYFAAYVLGMDNMRSSKNFNLESAVKTFPQYVKPAQNLLKANLILIPHRKSIGTSRSFHHALYVMNKYRNTIDVLDSLKWPTRISTQTTRSEFHKSDVKQLGKRFDALMQAIYGKEACKKSNQPSWTKIADTPHYMMPPQQEVNECGIYCLKFACTFDGDRCVEHIDNFDDRSQDWKAEYMFRIIFHEDNKLPLEDLLEEIQCLSPHSMLSTQGEELLLMLTQLPA